MPSNFSIHNILGIKEPEVVVLSSDSESEDNEAEVLKTELISVSTYNNGAQMVEVGIFMLECSSIYLLVYCLRICFCLRLLFSFHFFIFCFSQRISLIAYFLLLTFKFINTFIKLQQL